MRYSLTAKTLIQTTAAAAAAIALAGAPAFAQGVPNTTTGTSATNGSKMDGTSNRSQETRSGMAASGATIQPDSTVYGQAPYGSTTYRSTYGAGQSDTMAYNGARANSSNGLRTGNVNRDNSASAWGDSGAGQISRGEVGSGKTTSAKSRS